MAIIPSIPSLPLEVKAHILRLCNPSTLAQTSRVSLAFLQLSSPLLYNDIHIVGPEAMVKLLVSRDESAQPHLSPYLGIPSISSFTIDISTPRPSTLERFNFCTSRLPSSNQIRVKTLSIHLYPYPTFASRQLWSHLLPLFDPTIVDLTGTLLPDHNSPFPYGINLAPARWSNLERISLFGAPNDNGRMALAGFLDAGKERRVTIVLDLVEMKDGARLAVGLYEQQRKMAEIMSDAGGPDFSALGSSRLKELMIRVASKEAEKKMRSSLVGQWEERGVEESLRAEWRSRLRFEVVEKRVKALSLLLVQYSSP